VKFTAGGGHLRSAEADALDAWTLALQFANQVRAVQIATRFADREIDFHRVFLFQRILVTKPQLGNVM
jgi:hypothetical protein